MAIIDANAILFEGSLTADAVGNAVALNALKIPGRMEPMPLRLSVTEAFDPAEVQSLTITMQEADSEDGPWTDVPGATVTVPNTAEAPGLSLGARPYLRFVPQGLRKNRLRLAFIGANLEITNQGSGILILDEIDSNLSGKEAMSIATVLEKISKFYQIFAISHQPQLSSKAHSHFLVSKNGEISSVKLLNESEKITELARMISGETISKEALEFAKKLKN